MLFTLAIHKFSHPKISKSFSSGPYAIIDRQTKCDIVNVEVLTHNKTYAVTVMHVNDEET